MFDVKCVKGVSEPREGLRHEVYNELIADRFQVLADLKNWLNAH